MADKPIIFSAPMVRALLDGERYSLRFGAVMRAYSEAMADQIKDSKAIWGILE